MQSIVERSLQPSAWPATVWVLFATILSSLIYQIFSRPSFPKTAPKIWTGDDWPILGSSKRFYSTRRDMLWHARQTTKSGNFSFYIGKKRVVSFSGDAEARKTFFESKDLSFHIGHVLYFNASAVLLRLWSHLGLYMWFSKMVITMMKKDHLESKLSYVVSDTRSVVEEWAARSKANAEWQVMNPFNDIFRLIYRLTNRMVGAFEIAEDPKLLDYTLSVFQQFEKYDDPTGIVFPWLPTWGYLARLSLTLKLFWLFRSIVKKRQGTGQKKNDTFQSLLDTGYSLQQIVTFQIGALFAGQINSGVMTSWMPVFWSQYPKWKNRVKEEIDAAVAKHRTSPNQSPHDVLDTLSLDDWEKEFPIINLSLRECIRFGLTGADFRKNVGPDLQIGKSGEVIPKDAYAVFLIDNVHMNPEVYRDPETFDPGRYLDDRAEDRKSPHAYIGWGSGRHHCLGTRFAKLEAIIIGAYFGAAFDYELSDEYGNEKKEPPPPINRNQCQIQKPAEPIYLRYKARNT
ncbi:cytochrome P450 6A1 [Thozetella sp. PMI_491]|nr:cytochrome P450 6A1 [Thozetella sp. PMI_491]